MERIGSRGYIFFSSHGAFAVDRQAFISSLDPPTRYRHQMYSHMRFPGSLSIGCEMLPIMKDIAGFWGLSDDDFEFYLTIQNDFEGPVFYPYHMLSREQSRALEWGWSDALRNAEERISTRQRVCNRHAQNSGHGERLTPRIFLYWLCHYYCDIIQCLSEQHHSRSREFIRFSVLDR